MSVTRFAQGLCALRLTILVALSALLLNACGGGDGAPPPTMAASSDARISSSAAGSTAFINWVNIDGAALKDLSQIRYTIDAKPGSASRPVSVRYSFDALKRRGYGADGGSQIRLPVFGLYAGRVNRVGIDLVFSDASTQLLRTEISTASYIDPNAILDRPKILTARAPGSDLGFDFLYVKTGLGVPLVMDTDGEIRWVGPGTANGWSSTFYNNQFVVGDQKSLQFRRLELDGTSTDAMVISPTFTNFHHNIDHGKQGMLIEVDAKSGATENLESVIAEMTPSGAIIREWDFAAMLSQYMISQGDDPSSFIRSGIDWFHSNAATYDPADDSLIVSSRENFVIKVDYQTGNIIWILGDPTKHWYSFASLRAKALRLADGGLYPIGQHSLSINSDGLLMLFNNGTPSQNQPTDAPIGVRLGYSAISTYSIDTASLTAREVQRFEHGQNVLAPYCSSVDEGRAKSLLITYSAAKNLTTTLLTGLDANHQIAFEFEYPTTGCNTSWNSQIIAFDDLVFN